jgi:Cu-Zn family superoxide dismutase
MRRTLTGRPCRIWLLLLLGITTLLGRPPQTSAQQPTTARAELRNLQGLVMGQATLTTTETGAVKIQVEVSGFDPVAGDHGIHIHAVGKCEAPFASAGGHFNPAGAKHGTQNPDGPHTGDLPNIQFYGNGSAIYQTTTDRVTLGAGPTSLFDADGSALVIHAGPDDYKTDPAGNSGDRIACGAITPATR